MKNQTVSEMIHFYGIRGLLNLIADECEQETSIPYNTSEDKTTVEGDDLKILVNNLRQDLF